MSVNHDWYQTEEKVVINVIIKKLQELNCKVTIETDRLLIEADGDIRLELHLYESINPEKSSYKFGSIKVEVTLMKLVGRRWADLTKQKSNLSKEKADLTKAKTGLTEEKAATKPKVVNIYQKNWDSLAVALEQDKAEGEELFYEIYKKATSDPPRAMRKCINESYGTVLSTNLAEVSPRKTEKKNRDSSSVALQQDKAEEHGDEALKEIFKDAKPEAGRFMHKPNDLYGTVLKTNGAKVSAQKTETKPPNGADFVKRKDC